MGFEDGPDSGWPGTDWIENLVLAAAGPDAYDRWTFQGIPFESPEVREAFRRLGRIVFTDGSVLGGAKRAARTPFWEAQLPMVEQNPPGCWLHQFASFAQGFLPPGAAGRDTNAFPFPPVTEGSSRATIGGGEMIGAFAGRPEVREVVRLLLSPGIEDVTSQLSEGVIVANRRFDMRNYSPFLRHQAEVVYASLATDTFRFDGSDLMPPVIGHDLFWKAMMTYMAEGPESLDRILAELDAAWPDG